MAGGSSEQWDAEASTFDDEPDHGLLDPAVRRAWERLLLTTLPAPPCHVADIGCGTGSLSVLLAQAGYSVCGVDFSPRMIAAAKEKATQAQVSVEFVEGDAQAPPWPANSFDTVLARHVLWALPDPAAAVARWAELLKPDGTLILIEGRWSTNAGLTAAETTRLVQEVRSSVSVQRLDDEALWGTPIADERYLLVSRA